MTQVFTVYDKIAMESAPLFHAKSVAVAQRSFALKLLEAERPEDFQLLHLGSFDHEKNKAAFFEVPEEIQVAVPKQFHGKELKDE